MIDRDCIFCKIIKGEISSKKVYLIVLSKKVASAMKETLNCDGVNIVQNNGEAAGQTVFHFHMHIIPRYKDDGQVIGWEPHTSDPEVQAQLAEKIGQAIH